MEENIQSLFRKGPLTDLTSTKEAVLPGEDLELFGQIEQITWLRF
jgi:hypothetical protein